MATKPYADMQILVKNSKTGQEMYCSLKDVVIFIDAYTQVTLGEFLQTQEFKIKKANEDIQKLTKAVQHLTDASSKLNLK